jgi:exodeoxyribonuclease VII small subunit
MSSETKEIAFETALAKLEAIVQKLENGDLPLEESLKYYEEGVKLADLCSKRLTEAQKKVELLMKTSPGRFKTAPLGEAQETGKGKKKK